MSGFLYRLHDYCLVPIIYENAQNIKETNRQERQERQERFDLIESF